jgi:hypothetical protein
MLARSPRGRLVRTGGSGDGTDHRKDRLTRSALPPWLEIEGAGREESARRCRVSQCEVSRRGRLSRVDAGR